MDYAALERENEQLRQEVAGLKARLTQVEAAKVLGIQQPHVSELLRNRAGSFSVGRLIDFLTALGHNVEITVTPARKEHGAMSIVFA